MFGRKKRDWVEVQVTMPCGRVLIANAAPGTTVHVNLASNLSVIDGVARNELECVMKSTTY